MRLIKIMVASLVLLAGVVLSTSAAAERGIHVTWTADQTGIRDGAHTRGRPNNVVYDTHGEWSATAHEWTPGITEPAICHFDVHVSWTPPAGTTGVVYAKAWVHVEDTNNVTIFQMGEGRRDGPLSAANPGINVSTQFLMQPGWKVHVAFIGFGGVDGHAIQSGTGDDAHGTPNRSFFAASCNK